METPDRSATSYTVGALTRPTVRFFSVPGHLVRQVAGPLLKAHSP